MSKMSEIGWLMLMAAAIVPISVIFLIMFVGSIYREWMETSTKGRITIIAMALYLIIAFALVAKG